MRASRGDASKRAWKATDIVRNGGWVWERRPQGDEELPRRSSVGQGQSVESCSERLGRIRTERDLSYGSGGVSGPPVRAVVGVLLGGGRRTRAMVEQCADHMGDTQMHKATRSQKGTQAMVQLQLWHHQEHRI